MSTRPGICTISNGLGRVRSLGGAVGLQRKTGSFSLPGMALGPIRGLVASNFACPHAVNGGRNFSFTASMPRPPGRSLRGYCIQTADRSCERAEPAAGAWVVADCSLDCSLVWANVTGENANTIPSTGIEPASRFRIKLFKSGSSNQLLKSNTRFHASGRPLSQLADVGRVTSARPNRQRAFLPPDRNLSVRPRCSATPQFPSSAPICGAWEDLPRASCTTLGRLG
jgi:hypothetical protein